MVGHAKGNIVRFTVIAGCEWHHYDVIKWKHFPRYWPFVREIHRSPVSSPHKGQWRGWIHGWVNYGEARDLRHHRALYDVTVMQGVCYFRNSQPVPDDTSWCQFINIYDIWPIPHYGCFVASPSLISLVRESFFFLTYDYQSPPQCITWWHGKMKYCLFEYRAPRWDIILTRWDRMTHKRQCFVPALVQIMLCRLFGANITMLHTDCYHVIIGIKPCHWKPVLSISPRESVWGG